MREDQICTTSRCRKVLMWGGMVATAIIFAWLWGNSQVIHAQTAAPLVPVTVPVAGQAMDELQRAEGLSRVFRSAAQQVLPAVVLIKAGPSAVCPQCGRAHGTDEAHGESPKSLDFLGSGFVVAPNGIVLTNKHVVQDEKNLVVQTADGKQFRVVRVLADREQDAAVLQIDTKVPLPFVRLGNSDRIDIGDWVLTIGCPLELEQTVSAGIISAKNRSFCSKHPARYLQTDAVINPGSSGGPLVALTGEVIGITSSIASDDGGFQGIGFAVPANSVQRLLMQFTSPVNVPQK